MILQYNTFSSYIVALSFCLSKCSTYMVFFSLLTLMFPLCSTLTAQNPISCLDKTTASTSHFQPYCFCSPPFFWQRIYCNSEISRLRLLSSHISSHTPLRSTGYHSLYKISSLLQTAFSGKICFKSLSLLWTWPKPAASI